MKRLLLIIICLFCFKNNHGQDLIIKRNGDITNAKVLEVQLVEIKYKKSENLQGPSYSILKSEVFMIKYSNGSKDMFDEEKKPEIIKPITNNEKDFSDEIIVTAGNDIKCKVLDVTSTEIKFALNNADLQILSIKKADVVMIRYSSGIKVMMESNVVDTQNTKIDSIKNTTIDTSTSNKLVLIKQVIPIVEKTAIINKRLEADIIHTHLGKEIEAIVDSISTINFYYHLFNDQKGDLLKIKNEDVDYIDYSKLSKFNVPTKIVTLPIPEIIEVKKNEKPIAIPKPKVYHTIVTLNADEIEAEIISIEGKKIKYKAKGSETILEIKKSDVFKIKRENGTYELITQPE